MITVTITTPNTNHDCKKFCKGALKGHLHVRCEQTIFRSWVHLKLFHKLLGKKKFSSYILKLQCWVIWVELYLSKIAPDSKIGQPNRTCKEIIRFLNITFVVKKKIMKLKLSWKFLCSPAAAFEFRGFFVDAFRRTSWRRIRQEEERRRWEEPRREWPTFRSPSSTSTRCRRRRRRRRCSPSNC